MKPVLVVVLCSLAVVSLLASPPYSFAKDAAPTAESIQGGNPLPEGAAKATFPYMGKQSITFTSDAEVERMVGMVSFDDAGAEPLGRAEADGKGGGSFSFKVPVKAMTTGSKDRDGHLMGEQWMDAAKFPEIAFTSTKAQQVKPTVWQVTGTWKMHGVEKEISFLANVRYVGKVHYLADRCIRVKANFPLPLKDFGMTNQNIGGPAVAAAWDVSVDLLGVLGDGK